VKSALDGRPATTARPERRLAAKHRADRGFSLLEVMVAVTILAMALVVLARIVTGNVRATHHARMTTVATFLARAKISDLEQVVVDTGFGEMTVEDEGDFSEEGFPRFRWYAAIERIELPTDAVQKTEAMAQEAAQSDNPMEMLTGMMGGFMSTLLEPIRVGIEESVRRLTVRVTWDELGRPDRSFEVVAFLTDPSKLDMALAAPSSATGGGGSSSGGSTPGGGSPGTRAAGIPGLSGRMSGAGNPGGGSRGVIR
jgi:general secretion pathway protein I